MYIFLLSETLHILSSDPSSLFKYLSEQSKTYTRKVNTNAKDGFNCDILKNSEFVSLKIQ